MLIIACVVAVAGLIERRDDRAWALAAGACAGAIVAYCLSRTSGLPAASDDIGNWSESLGMAALFVEGAVVLMALRVWVGRK